MDREERDRIRAAYPHHSGPAAQVERLVNEEENRLALGDEPGAAAAAAQAAGYGYQTPGARRRAAAGRRAAAARRSEQPDPGAGEGEAGGKPVLPVTGRQAPRRQTTAGSRGEPTAGGK